MEIIISISNNITEGFKSKTIDFYTLPNYTKNFNYSFGVFDGGYRNKQNTMYLSSVLCYDIDDGLPIEECRELLSNWSYLIITSKSHRVSKNGKITDRYRLILPLDKRPCIDDYSEFYDYVGNMLGINHDKATKDISRFYFPNKKQEVYTNRIHPNKQFDYSLLHSMFLQEKARKIEESKHKQIKITIEGSTDGLIHWFKINTVVGGRNNYLFRLRKALETNNIEDAKIISAVLDVNSSLDEPLSESELQKTVLRGLSEE
jgi:hypothetical protein